MYYTEIVVMLCGVGRRVGTEEKLMPSRRGNHAPHESSYGGLQAMFMTTINSLLVLTMWLSNSRRESTRVGWKMVESLSPSAMRARALSIVHELYLSLDTSVFLKAFLRLLFLTRTRAG